MGRLTRWLPTVLSVAALIAAVVGLLSARQAQADADRLDDRVTALEEQIGEPAGFDDLDSRLTDLEDADLDSRVSDLDSGVSDLDSGVSDLDSRVSDLEDADLDNRVTGVEQSVTDICDAVTNTNTNSAIQEMVDDITFACP